MIDLVIADDHEVFVDALVGVLNRKGFLVTGVATSLAGAVETTRRLEPDVCVLDRYFTDGDAVEALGGVMSASPGTKVLILTADRDADQMWRALRSGASGYVSKLCDLSALAGAIEKVVAGEVVAELGESRPARPPEGSLDAHRLAAQLTARERECLGLLVAGAGTGAMVRHLGVSSTTVRTHVQSLLTKLGVHSRLEAVSFAVQHALLDDAWVERRASG